MQESGTSKSRMTWRQVVSMQYWPKSTKSMRQDLPRHYDAHDSAALLAVLPRTAQRSTKTGGQEFRVTQIRSTSSIPRLQEGRREKATLVGTRWRTLSSIGNRETRWS